MGFTPASVRWAIGCLGLGLALAGMIAASPAASAKTFKAGPFRYVSTSLQTQPGLETVLTAPCPDGTRLAGGGGGIGGPAADTRLGSIAPYNNDLDGLEDDGYLTESFNNSQGPVTTRAIAACLRNAKGGSQLLYNESSSSTVNQGASVGTGVNSACASGRAVGGGVYIPGSATTDTSERLNSSHPLDLGGDRVHKEGWSASMNITNNNPFAITPKGYAVCLPAGAAKARYRFKTKVVWPGDAATLKVPCPKGFRVSGGGTQGFFTRVLLSLPFDNKDKKKAPDNGWRVKVHNGPGGNPQALVAHAICLKPKK